MSAMTDPSREARARAIRARNRALLVVLATLAALFYAIAMVRIGG